MSKKLTKDQYELIDVCVTRALALGLYASTGKLTAMMDLANATKHYDLDLNVFAHMENVDFCHDIMGIQRAINRSAYPVTFDYDPLFAPRCPKCQTEKTEKE